MDTLVVSKMGILLIVESRKHHLNNKLKSNGGVTHLSFGKCHLCIVSTIQFFVLCQPFKIPVKWLCQRTYFKLSNHFSIVSSPVPRFKVQVCLDEWTEPSIVSWGSQGHPPPCNAAPGNKVPTNGLWSPPWSRTLDIQRPCTWMPKTYQKHLLSSDWKTRLRNPLFLGVDCIGMPWESDDF